MNYTSAALGVIAVISAITGITTGRHKFTGPDMENDQENERGSVPEKLKESIISD